MAHKKIGVQNFRVFKDYTEFELRPITLLTGPNNSGKSSFIKLLLLLKNGLGSLDFKKGKHNLEDYKKILNWESDSNEIKIHFETEIPFFKEVTLDYYYKEGRVSKIVITKDKKSLLKYTNEIKGPIEWAPWAGSNSFYEYYSINIGNLLKFLYEGKFEYIIPHWTGEGFEYEWLNPQKIEDRFKTVQKQNLNTKKVNISNYRKNNDLTVKVDDNIFSLLAIRNEILKLKKDFLLFNLFINGENKTDYHTTLLLRLQKKAFRDVEFEDAIEIEELDILSNFTHNISYLFKEVKLIFKKYIKRAFKKFNEDKIEVKVSRLGQILFQENWFQFEPFDKESGENIISQLGRFDPEFKSLLNQVDYLSANRGNQRRVLQNESEVEIDKIVADFAERSNKNLEFIEKAFKIMEIPGKLIPVRYENTISVIYLEHEGKKVSLADLGFGFSQLIPIFLKIIMSKNILIIEEPEANLHPDLQAKLADILNLAVTEFPAKKLIIETHSEYLIRKLQYLTAKKELSPEQSVIYYFNADKYVSQEEPKVKKIEITQTGNLTDTFGPGFYDEATRLQFDLMKINQEQNN
ncbi:DUF3696 domain-containing protein [Salegentibacter sp. Hel_I_6]|uniref:DUF3696 domain-containing protein n=1 Tax=Salegentibacter sp. Hel_I_6 TaxID=1250278 RepID=UPI000560A078|nr:DUF3696 domain-containing protein [Salegentibacter sp. Hel_I_6]